MTIGMTYFASGNGLLSDEDVLPSLEAWQREGQRTALVTLVSVEGGAPRQAGAQMAVAEDGRYAGYLSGGCLEAAVALEAQAAIREGRNRQVRYGRGSPYFDVKLPCGSGLDLYFDQAIDRGRVTEMTALAAQRRAFTLSTDLESGQSRVDAVPTTAPMARSARAENQFVRVYPPALRLFLLGTGPAVSAIASLSQSSGLEIAVWSPDEATRREVTRLGLPAHDRSDALSRGISHLDAASAAVLVFHDHGAEPGILARVLKTEAFYIGVLGNHAVHRERVAALAAEGFDATSRTRLRAPVGSIPAAKSKATLAAGVLAEILDTAKTLNLTS